MSSGVTCSCGKTIFTDNYPTPYNYYFDKEIHYSEMLNENLLRIENLLPKKSNEHPFYWVAMRMRGSSFRKRETFVRCPICGRIHIFWPDGDNVTIVTYVPEEMEECNLSLSKAIDIEVPYPNRDID